MTSERGAVIARHGWSHIVTILSEVSENVAELLKIKVLGMVENMSYLTCPKCGERIEVFSAGAGRKIAESFEVPLLGKIPIDPKTSKQADNGIPFVDFSSRTSEAFEEIVKRIEKALS